jgi:hypothetical protein
VGWNTYNMVLGTAVDRNFPLPVWVENLF